MKLSAFAKIIFASLLFVACNTTQKKETQTSDPLAKASREDKNGWIYVHLEGSPHDVGYQQGFLLPAIQHRKKKRKQVIRLQRLRVKTRMAGYMCIWKVRRMT